MIYTSKAGRLMDANGRGRRRFGDFEFDSEAGKLFRDGQAVKIQPQPLRVLEVLIERPGEIVSREELRSRVWGETTFVEFDQALNYSIRQIRLALGDEASEPLYIETLPKQGYRFIAGTPSTANGNGVHPVGGGNGVAEPIAIGKTADLRTQSPPDRAPVADAPQARSGYLWPIAAVICIALAIAGVVLYSSLRVQPSRLKYTQLTDFTDSAVDPALSPDGRMMAFIRGGNSFLSADQVYVKMLPDGEAKRLTEDPRMKYGLAFSPDGSRIAYTVLEPPSFSTYAVSILGGDPQLLLSNAAGLTWLDEHQLLFSEIQSGMHLGVVSAAVTREDLRELYFPQHERGMAHYSSASPDRKSALVVEMNELGGWAPCRLISLSGPSPGTPIGPEGTCTSAGWSPDGLWMYFIAVVEGQSHLWRQRFPNGRPEQITAGPIEEDGLAVDQDGRSVITSMGAKESAIWLHDSNGDRSLSSEGEIVTESSPPSFGTDDEVLYYLLRHHPVGSGPGLWRMVVKSGRSESVFPGVSMIDYDLSPDGNQVVYSAAGNDGKSHLWVGPTDRSEPVKPIGDSGGASQPHFGPQGRVLFRRAEGTFNYLEQMNLDGSGRAKVVPYPISEIQSVSPGRRWVIAVIPFAEGHQLGIVAIPPESGPPQRICSSYCVPIWSSGGKFLFVPVEEASRTSPGRSLAIPVGPGESLPEFPAGGIKPLSDSSVVPGAQSFGRAALVPGRMLDRFAYVNTTVHRNLYRISLP